MGTGDVNDLPDFQERLLKGPSIFAFAKNAGYRTAYLSGQSWGDQLQNYMTKFDLDDLDYFHQPIIEAEEDPSFADELLALKLKEYLTQNENNFIYVVKSGSHFPWQNNFPSIKEIFIPVLDENQSLSGSDHLLKLNTYLHAISWKTDHFFQTLLSDISILDNTLIIYTSDHGQVIHSEESKLTHCSTHNPLIDEGIVPLLYFSNQMQKVDKLISLAKGQSHKEIIPITLKAMGYDLKISQYEEPTGFFYGHLFPKNRIQQSGFVTISSQQLLNNK